MSVKRAKKDIQDNSTQRYLPFSQIKENIVVMKDSSARVILKCSTINFQLKSTEEQDAIIMSYQRFLNSIDFPVEIMVRSTKLDI
jgi:type IV secretory pathway VirB4 component